MTFYDRFTSPQLQTIRIVYTQTNHREMRRPGSARAVQLFASNDAKVWRAALENYNAAVQAVGRARKKEADLIGWDQWMKSDLKQLTELSLSDLCKVVNWKLTRGKFRPLMGQVRRNSEDTVKQATREALAACAGMSPGVDRSLARKLLDDLSKQLKGVGPATASALLAHVRPEEFPFMADEALEGAGMERKYTLAQYCSFREELIDKRRTIPNLAEFTLNDMSDALWTAAMEEVYGLNKDTASRAGSSGKKRKVEENEEEEEEAGEKRKSRRVKKQQKLNF